MSKQNRCGFCFNKVLISDYELTNKKTHTSIVRNNSVEELTKRKKNRNNNVTK